MLNKSFLGRMLGCLCVSVLPVLGGSSVENVADKLATAFGRVRTLHAEGRTFECEG